MTTSELRSRRIALLLAGLSIPILPRLLVPLFAAGPFVDTLSRMFESPVAGLFMMLWTAIPFAALASMLRTSSDPARRLTVVVAAVVCFAVGFVIHMPARPGTGANMGIAFFPLYAAVIIAFVRFAMTRLLSRGRHVGPAASEERVRS